MLGSGLIAQNGPIVTADELSSWAHYLASDEMKGRRNGSEEMKEVAQFIADQFQKAGLETFEGLEDYIQEYTVQPRRGESFKERNVVGFLKGSDPELSKEYIIYTAHFDHIGIGRVIDGDSIYNGANDNAAGTTTLLGLAHTWKRNGHRPARSVIFLAVSGEEMGMHGSRYFMSNPPISTDDIFLDFNIEMTGHCTLLGPKRYYITGPSFTNFDEILDEYNQKTDWKRVDTISSADGLMFASDNVAFAVKTENNKRILNIPGHTLCTHGGENHIHRPNDEPEFMNYNNMADLVAYLDDLGLFLGKMDRDRIQWNQEAFEKFSKGRRR